jgi:hypothetical protein
LFTDGRTPWTSDQPVAMPLPTETQNKHIHKHPCLEWDSESTIPASEREKTAHALDRAATVADYVTIHTPVNIVQRLRAHPLSKEKKGKVVPVLK